MILSIGIETDIKLVERLTLVQEDIGKIIEARGARVRWVAPENMHMPICYLGHFEDGVVPEMLKCIDRAVSGIAPFTISTVAIEAYPSPQIPRIIAVSTQKGCAQVMALRFAIDEILSKTFYLSDPRPFRPLMTLGRIATPDKRLDIGDVVNAIKDLNFGVSEVNEVVLYGAELLDKGAEFKVISRHLLGTQKFETKQQSFDNLDEGWRL